jgi:hypothetical protein
VGIYVTDRENLAPEIVAELGRSRRWSVDQRWVALGEGPAPTALGAVTITRVRTRVPKFALLNRVLEECDLSRYEFVLVCDDDITLPESFVDRYLELVVRHDLALAQPARTHGSYIDHYLVEQLDGLDARRTRFVEIGPLFSIRRDAFRAMLPFDEASPMGWGYDFVWPLVMEQAGLRMGIVDATPVDHRIRKPGANYSGPASNRDMKAYLARRPHLAPAQAFSILEAYA